MFDFDESVTPEKRRVYTDAALSSANAQLHGIINALEDVSDKIDTFLDEEHGDECDCEFCADNKDAGHAVADLEGFIWSLDCAKAFLQGYTYGTPDSLKKAMAKLQVTADEPAMVLS